MSARPARTSTPSRPSPSFDRRSRYPYVRSVRGKTGTYVWQARPFLNATVGHVNLGCYHEERAAWEAIRRWVRAGADPCRGLPPGVLPKWVVRRPQDGRYDALRRRRGGTRVSVPGGPWATPGAAFAAALAAVERDQEAGRSWAGLAVRVA